MSLGRSPATEDLTLTAGADFEHVLTPDTAYPAGMSARIAFFASAETDADELTSWSATTATTSEVSWRIESEVADTISAHTYYRLYAIFAGSPTLERCWFRGRVVREQ